MPMAICILRFLFSLFHVFFQLLVCVSSYFTRNINVVAEIGVHRMNTHEMRMNGRQPPNRIKLKNENCVCWNRIFVFKNKNKRF